MNILITGIDGFLGKAILGSIKKEGNRIIGLNRKKGSELPNVEKVYSTPEELINSEKNFDLIFHTAAFIPYGNYATPHENFIKTNIALTATLSLQYLTARIVYASSVAVFGTPLTSTLNIHSPLNNPDLYGLSKLAGEAIIRNHPKYSIIRYSSIIGRGMKTASIIPKMINDAKNNRLIQVWGTGERKQNYIDIRDAARLAVLCGNFEKNISCLGVAEKSYSNLEVANIIAELTKAEIKFINDDPSPSFVFDPSVEYSELNFHPQFDIYNTIQEML